MTDAPALPTLPHALVHEICHYLWPADVARLAGTCRSLGAKEEVRRQALSERDMRHDDTPVDRRSGAS